MDTLLEILSPDFLLRNAFHENLLVGLCCPLIGLFLVFRRLAFLGVALPQVSTVGIAFALSPLGVQVASFLHILAGHGDSTEIHATEQQLLALLGSVTATLIAVIVLAVLERRGRGVVEGRLGTVYVVASAAAILLIAKNPQAERGYLNLLKGEIIAVSNHELHLTFFIFAAVLTTLFVFKREILLVSIDPDMALTLRKNLLAWDLLLYILIGFTISVAVFSVGPLVAFGFLLIPPLTAHLFGLQLRQFALFSSITGLTCALLGFWVAYRFDLPVGPTDVVLLGLVYTIAFIVKRFTK